MYSTVGNGIWSVPSRGRRASTDRQRREKCGPVARRTTSCIRASRRDRRCGGRWHPATRVLPRRPRLPNSHMVTAGRRSHRTVNRSRCFWLRRGGTAITGSSRRTAMRLAELTADFQEGGAPAWTPDGKSLLIRSSRAGSMNLWRVSVADGTLERLTSGAGDDFDPAVSPDGRTILFANVKRTWEVIVQDLHSGKRRTVLARRTLMVFPRFSPDGRRIALAGRNSRGETHLFVMDADGSNLTAVTDGAGELNIMPQWGGDGDSVVLLSGTTDPDVSKRLGLGWRVARDCAVVVRSPVSGSGGSPRGQGRLFVRRTRALCSSRVYAISKPDLKPGFPSRCTSSDFLATVDSSPANPAITSFSFARSVVAAGRSPRRPGMV